MTKTSRKISLHLAEESGGYAVDPSADGSTGYLPARVLGPPEGSLILLQDARELLETNYFTGRNAPTAHEIGDDAAMLTIDMPLIGNSAAAAATQAPPADDALALLLNNAFGTAAVFNGMAVSSSASTTLTTATSTAGIQDLLAVRDAAVQSGRTQWRRTSSSASPYTVHRAWDTNPTNTGVAYGTKRWTFNDAGGGYSLAAYYVLDGTPYTLLGGRVMSLKLSLPAGKLCKLTAQIMFDSKTQASKSSITAGTVPSWTGSPIFGELASIEWGGTVYESNSVELDFGVDASEDESVTGAQGRSSIDVLEAMPTVTINPLFATSWETDARAGTTRNLLIRYGAGSLGGGILNTFCFWAEAAQAMIPKLTDDKKRLRQQVQLKVRDPGIFTGTTPGRFWQLARA